MPDLAPLLAAKTPVDWWFAFKFNSATYPGDESLEPNPGLFGGTPKDYQGEFCLRYALASSAAPALTLGSGYLGTTVNDPLGATFNQIYHGDAYYVLWNDQFYNHPLPSRDAPWGHSKGCLAWDDSGNGFVLQVSTPSWPASGSASQPRADDGNTLGCINDDDIKVSQHFFALRLTPEDVITVLQGLSAASVVTDPGSPQLVRNGGPAAIQTLVRGLGKETRSSQPLVSTLSKGMTLIAKPAGLQVPPWQMVSALLGGVSLRVASWWAAPEIPSTAAGTLPQCWAASLGTPGAVQIATSGTWNGESIGLQGGDGKIFNHAKLGVALDPGQPLSIFADMNQQGSLNGAASEKAPCSCSQNGRGGLFYVLHDAALHASLSQLLNGDSAPLASP